MRPSPSLQRTILFCLKGIGVVLFLWILTRIDRAEFFESLKHVSPLPLIMGFLLFPVILALKSYRWHTLLKQHGITQSYAYSFLTYCSALFLGTLTPGNAGEAIKIAYLTQAGADLKAATLLTAVDRLYDALWVGLFAVPAVLFLLPERILGVTIALLGVIACVLVLQMLLKRSLTWKPHALTILNWATYYLQLWLFAEAFHIHLPLLFFIGVMTLAGIANLLAIAPAGLGTRDAVIYYFFQSHGIAASVAVAFSSSIFVLTLLGSLIGGICLLKLHHR